MLTRILFKVIVIREIPLFHCAIICGVILRVFFSFVVLVVLVFLCYNLVEGARAVEPNLYDKLNPLADSDSQPLEAIPS